MKTKKQTIEQKAVLAMIEAHNDGYGDGSQWKFTNDNGTVIVTGHGVHKLGAAVSMLFCGVCTWCSGQDEITIAVN